MSRLRPLLVLVGLLALGLPLAASPASAAVPGRSSVTMYSDPGDYIGQGAAQLFDSNNAQITVGGSRNTLQLAVSGGSSGTSFTFDIAAPGSTPLKVGVYERAQRASFRTAGRPGLDIYGDGRGCNEVAGSFEIRDIAFTPAGLVSRLHLLYEQHCEGGPAALFGELRIKEPAATGLAAESSSVTWPETAPGAQATVVPVTLRAVGHAVAIASVKVTGADAASFPIRVDGCTRARLTPAGSCQVLLRFAPAAGGPRGAFLVVTDGGGHATTVQLDGLAGTGRTAVSLTGDKGDYVTGGRSYSFAAATSSVVVTGSRQLVRARVDNGTDNFEIDLVPAPGDVIAPGTYTGATRYPFNGSAPGLSVDGDGRGCNTLTGSFSVSQAEFSAVDGSLQHLLATFVQHCEGVTAALRGELAYHAVADITGPARVSGLTATPTSGGARLSWTDPKGDWQRTVVRALPGATAPTSPTTGIAIPVAAGTAVATGLQPGTAYAFAVFPVDRTGNVGPASVVRVTAGAGSATLEL